MRGLDRYELHDYEYERQELEDEYEEDEEAQYEEEEPPKPTKEAMEYLQFRERLKESILKKRKESSGSLASSSDKMKKLPSDNYGSFFGPSQPVIAQRVIQESKSLLENPHLASRLSNSHQINKNKNSVSNGGSNSSVPKPPPRLNETKSKAQKIKDTRDYSFLLSDDVELPARTKEAAPRKLPVRNSDGRPAQVTGKSKQPLSSGLKQLHGSQEDRKRVPAAGRLPPKSGSSNKLVSTSKPSMRYADSRRQLSNSSGNGPNWPVGPKGLHSKTPVGVMGTKYSASGVRNPVNGVQKPLPLKVQSPTPKQIVELRREFREPNRPKIMPKQPVASSKPQMNKPPRPNPTHSVSQDHRPKKKPVRRYSDDEDDDGGKAISMIRKMFGYNPNKFVDEDDDDDNMEANFDEIMKEEKRSAKIAKREDEEQLRLIEEEEERKRKRRSAKLDKRKLAN